MGRVINYVFGITCLRHPLLRLQIVPMTDIESATIAKAWLAHGVGGSAADIRDIRAVIGIGSKTRKYPVWVKFLGYYFILTLFACRALAKPGD